MAISLAATLWESICLWWILWLSHT